MCFDFFHFLRTFKWVWTRKHILVCVGSHTTLEINNLFTLQTGHFVCLSHASKLNLQVITVTFFDRQWGHYSGYIARKCSVECEIVCISDSRKSCKQHGHRTSIGPVLSSPAFVLLEQMSHTRSKKHMLAILGNTCQNIGITMICDRVQKQKACWESEGDKLPQKSDGN